MGCAAMGGEWRAYDCATADAFLESHDGHECEFKAAWAPKCCGVTCNDMCSPDDSLVKFISANGIPRILCRLSFVSSVRCVIPCLLRSPSSSLDCQICWLCYSNSVGFLYGCGCRVYC